MGSDFSSYILINVSISLQIMMSVRWSMFVAMAPVQITLAASAVIVPKGSYQDHMKSVKVNIHEDHYMKCIYIIV